MENPSYEDDEVSIVPARFSAISASNVLVLGREKSKDKLNFGVYFTFLLLGMGSLLPTNFFFTPAMFWHERFATGNETHVNQMQEFWQNSLTFVLMGTVLVMSTVTPLLERHCCSITVLGSIAMLGITVMFIIVASLSCVNISAWQIIYFVINLICASLISVFAAIYQVASVTLASSLPNRYMEAVFSGQAVAGITASVINIIALGCTDNQQTSAVVFFGMAAGITLIIFVAFVRLLRNPFFLTFRDDPYLSDSKRTTVMSMGSRFSLADLGASTQRIADLIKRGMTKRQLMKVLWPEMLTSFNSPFLTMSLFPGLLAHTRSNATVGLWSERFFVPVLTFLVFNCADYIGRVLTSFKCLSLHIRTVTFASFLRYGFWVIFPLCQIDGKSMRIPTLFTDDWMYALIVTVFGISNGYCTGMAFLHSSTKLRKAKANVDDLSMGSYFVFISMVFGLFTGTIMSFIGKYAVFNM